jgi:adenosylhomocysteine nucleosidase
MRLAVIAALPNELVPAIKRFKAVKGAGNNLYDIYLAADSSTEILFVITGMGVVRALDALKAVNSGYKPDIVLSAGFGGAIYEGAEGGELVWAREFVSLYDNWKATTLKMAQDQDIIGRMEIPFKQGVFISVPRLTAKKEIIRTLASPVTNPVCDMETYALAEFCFNNGIRFLAVRAITDLADQDITPDIADIVDESGKYSLVKAIRTLLKRPWLLPLLMGLGINSHKASRNLEKAIAAVLTALRG